MIKDLKKIKKNRDLVIVSSGAIALGQKYLKVKKKKIKLEMSQAIAAVGQIHLAGEFQKIFEKNKFKTGQILISLDDTEQRRRALNVRRTFEADGLPERGEKVLMQKRMAKGLSQRTLSQFVLNMKGP